MCGIVCIACSTPRIGMVESTLDLFYAQITRGNKGFGLAIVVPDLKVKTYRATMETQMAFKAIGAEKANPRILATLFHHRFPTSTSNTLQTTHPFLISHESFRNNYLLVHNGVINNDFSLAKTQKDLGFVHKAWDGNKLNDSEPGCIEFAKAIENPGYKVGAKGSQAYVGYVLNKETNEVISVVFGTNGSNPLKYSYDEKDKSIMLASELHGGMSALKDTLYTFELETGTLRSREIEFEADNYSHLYGRKYGFEDYDSETGFGRGNRVQQYQRPSYQGSATTASGSYTSGASVASGTTTSGTTTSGASGASGGTSAASGSSARAATIVPPAVTSNRLAAISGSAQTPSGASSGPFSNAELSKDCPANDCSTRGGGAITVTSAHGEVVAKPLCQSYDRQISMLRDMISEFKDMLSSREEAQQINITDYVNQAQDLFDAALEAALLGYALEDSAAKSSLMTTNASFDAAKELAKAKQATRKARVS